MLSLSNEDLPAPSIIQRVIFAVTILLLYYITMRSRERGYDSRNDEGLRCCPGKLFCHVGCG